jgi:radial spoke head protein 4/6
VSHWPGQFEVDDIVAHGALLEAVGAGLGANEMYAAMLAAKRLGEDPSLGVASVRFFGKVLGTHTDYYIFETNLREAPEDDASATGEPKTSS